MIFVCKKSLVFLLYKLTLAFLVYKLVLQDFVCGFFFWLLFLFVSIFTASRLFLQSKLPLKILCGSQRKS